MTSRYIVSKTSFFNLLTSADGMLDSLGRFSSPTPFSHSYHVFSIRRFGKKDPQHWLTHTFIPQHADWMIRLENDPVLSTAPTAQLTQANVETSIQSAQFIKADRFIKAQLNIAIRHLLPEPELWQRLAHSHELVAWKVSDQLMFMNDAWSWDHSCWTISLKTALNECHIMAVQLKYGMVFIQFYYPIV
jgi:hypothetical protein